MNDQKISVSTAIPPHAQKVFTGKFFDIYQWPQELYDGSIAIFERAKRPNTAGVVAITPDKKILVTQQEQPLHTPFWGLLGGVVDSGEDSLAAAQRELLEESGHTANRWQHWFTAQPSVRVEWMIDTYLAYDVTKVREVQLDPGEKITVHEFTFAEFVELVQQDSFRDQEVALQVLKAKSDPVKWRNLQKLFFEN